MLDSAWGKAMNLNLNGLPEIELPGDHFSPGGAYFVEDVTETPLVARRVSSHWVTGLSRRRFDWTRFERMGEVFFGSSCPRRSLSFARRARRPWRRS